MHERRSRLSGSEPTQAASLVSQIQQQARQAGADLLGLLFPSLCAGCGRVDEVLCAACRANFVSLQPPWCARCGQPLESQTDLCPACQRRAPPYLICRGVFRFEGPLRAALHALKYEGREAVGAILAAEMVRVVRRQLPGGEAWPLDAALAVPLHPARQAIRGYNQARLLVEPLAEAWGLPVMDDALSRVIDTPSQLGLNARQRRDNVRAAFHAQAGRVSGLNVLLVDDVRTTGATLEACTLALLAAGASSVRALTLALVCSNND